MSNKKNLRIIFGCHFGRSGAAPAILAVTLSLVLGSTYGFLYSIRPYSYLESCSPLPPKGGYFLTACQNSSVLFNQCRFPLIASGLANLENHRIITPLVAGINLFHCNPVQFLQSLAIELQHLFRANTTAIDGTLVARDSDTRKDIPGLNPSLAGNRETQHDFFSGHFYTLW
jgi:hypothetical protein